MPAGIGLHPFFPKTPATRLRFAADAVWTSDRRMLPESRVAVPPAFDFTSMRAVDALDVDNCFDGWGRGAVIEWPERKWGMALEASKAFGHLVVFTGPGRNAIAVEPVSHVNNALNLAAVRNDTGLVDLGPGDTLEGTVRFAPFALGD